MTILNCCIFYNNIKHIPISYNTITSIIKRIYIRNLLYIVSSWCMD